MTLEEYRTYFFAVFRIRIRFLRIQILDFFPNLDPNLDPGSGSRQQITNFSKAKTKFWEKFLFSSQKVGILFLFSTNQVGVRELLFGIINKINENH